MSSSTRKTYRTGAAALAMLVAASATLPATANAERYRNYRDGWRQERHAPQRDYTPHRDHRPNHHVEKRRDNTARNIALGIGALILGTIISEEIRRNR